MIPRRVVLLGCVLLVLMVLHSSSAWAQFTSGIEGTVSDPTGAVVPGATVTIKNEETGASQTVQTQDSGSFRFTTLSSSAFTVSAAAQGIQDHHPGTCSTAGSRNQDSQHPHGGGWNGIHGHGN